MAVKCIDHKQGNSDAKSALIKIVCMPEQIWGGKCTARSRPDHDVFTIFGNNFIMKFYLGVPLGYRNMITTFISD